MARDDELAAVHGARPRPRRADDGPRRERRPGRPARQARAGAPADTSAIHHALTRPEFVEAEATDRAARIAEYDRRVAVRRPRHLRRGGRRDRGRPAARRAGDRRDLHPVPRQHDRRPAPARASRAAATSARRRCATRPTTSRCGTTCERGVLESVSTDHCPFNDEQKARGLRRLQPGAQRPGGDPAPPRQAVGRGRRRRAGSRRSQLVDRTSHDDRAPLRPGRQGRDRARQGRRHRRLRPQRAARLRHGTRSFMNVDYDLYEGETASAIVRHTLLARDARLRPRARSSPSPGHGRFVARARAPRVAVSRMTVVPARRRPASSPTSTSWPRRAAAGIAGAKRLAWSPEWHARARVAARQARRDRRLDRRPRRGRATCGPTLRGRARARSSSSARTSTRCPSGGWLDGALGLLTALGVAARAGRAPARRRRSACGSSTGPTRRARASAAACVGSSAVAGTLDPDDVRDLLDADGHAAAGRAGRVRRRPRRRGRARPRASTARVAYLELHIEQGPVLLDTGRLASAVSGTVGVERYLIDLHAARPRTPARRRCTCAATRSRRRRPRRWRSARSASATAASTTVGAMHSEPGGDHGGRGRQPR